MVRLAVLAPEPGEASARASVLLAPHLFSPTCRSHGTPNSVAAPLASWCLVWKLCFSLSRSQGDSRGRCLWVVGVARGARMGPDRVRSLALPF